MPCSARSRPPRPRPRPCATRRCIRCRSCRPCRVRAIRCGRDVLQRLLDSIEHAGLVTPPLAKLIDQLRLKTPAQLDAQADANRRAAGGGGRARLGAVHRGRAAGGVDRSRLARAARRGALPGPAGPVPGVRLASGGQRDPRRRAAGLSLPAVLAVQQRMAHGPHQVLELRFDQGHRLSRHRGRQRGDQGRVLRTNAIPTARSATRRRITPSSRSPTTWPASRSTC